MKRLFSIAALLALTLGGFAQDGFLKEVRINAIAGANLSKISGLDYAPDLKLGWQIGASAEIPVKKDFKLLGSKGELFIYPALMLIEKGGKGSEHEENVMNYHADITRTVNPMYLELPVRIAFKETFSKSALTAFMGPYVAYGISGKYKAKYKGELAGSALGGPKPQNCFSEEIGLKRLDFGFGAGLRYDLLKYRMFAELGVENSILKINRRSGSCKNRSFMLTFGYNVFNK